jgi:hypothetical protein
LYPARPGERILLPARRAEYQALIGSLLFLSVGCSPEITEAVNEFSRFLAAPTEEHERAAHRLLRYLYGTMDMGMIYRAAGDIDDDIHICKRPQFSIQFYLYV